MDYHIKSNLMFLCQKQHISLNSIKRATNIHQSNLSKLVNDKIQEKNVTLLTIIKLCCFFRISLDTFVRQDLQTLNINENSSDSKVIKPNIYVRHNFNHLYKNTSVTKYNIFKYTVIRSHVLLQILNGRINEENLTIETVIKLADYFNVSLDDFVFKDLSNQDSNETNKNCGK